jgi:hypothetical protein
MCQAERAAKCGLLLQRHAQLNRRRGDSNNFMKRRVRPQVAREAQNRVLSASSFPLFILAQFATRTKLIDHEKSKDKRMASRSEIFFLTYIEYGRTL